jgi:two-component system, sensor histidine kinase
VALTQAFDRTAKILLIDFDSDSCSLLRKDLQAAHYDVITAQNEQEGLCLAATINPDLIMINLINPQQNPYAVCGQLKNDSNTRTIPVILITSRDELQDIAAGLRLKAVDYVVKPYRIKELQGRIQGASVLLHEQQKNYDELQQLKADFLSMLLIELRTPVTVISGFTELLKKKTTGIKPSMPVQYLQSIIEHANQISDLIDDIQHLLCAKVVYEPVDLISTVQATVDQFRKKNASNNRWPVLQLPEQASLLIWGNGRHLSMALRHLLYNAGKSKSQEGSMNVTVIPMNHGVRIEVCDREIDTLRSRQRSILEGCGEGERASTMIRRGVSLSLMIVRWIAEKHHGKVGVESRQGQGICFWIDLPLSHHRSGFS